MIFNDAKHCNQQYKRYCFFIQHSLSYNTHSLELFINNNDCLKRKIIKVVTYLKKLIY